MFDPDRDMPDGASMLIWGRRGSHYAHDVDHAGGDDGWGNGRCAIPEGARLTLLASQKPPRVRQQA